MIAQGLLNHGVMASHAPISVVNRRATTAAKELGTPRRR